MRLSRPQLQHAARVCVVASLLSLASCRDKDPVATEDLPRCNGPVTVTTSADPAPVIRWTPACRTSYVEVREAIDILDVAWALYSPDAMLAPGLRYGAAPSGAETLTPARPLGADTSYFLTVGVRSVSPFSESTSGLGGAAITACGLRVGGNCRTTAEVFSHVTAEGIRVEASVTRPTVPRGDTTWLVFRFVNPTAQAITVDPLDACWLTRMAVVTPTGRSGFVVTCGEPVPTLAVPANGAVEQRFAFDGYQQILSSTWACRVPGTYKARLLVNSAVGGRRVSSPEIAWTLTERASARGICAGDV